MVVVTKGGDYEKFKGPWELVKRSLVMLFDWWFPLLCTYKFANNQRHLKSFVELHQLPLISELSAENFPDVKFTIGSI